MQYQIDNMDFDSFTDKEAMFANKGIVRNLAFPDQNLV